MPKDPDGLDSGHAAGASPRDAGTAAGDSQRESGPLPRKEEVSALDALPPLPEITLPPPLPPTTSAEEVVPPPLPELDDDGPELDDDWPELDDAEPDEEPTLPRAEPDPSPQRERRKTPHLVTAWLAGTILGAVAGVGLLSWEAAVIQAAGLPFAMGDRLLGVALAYAGAGAGIGLIGALAGQWGPRWALTAGVTLVGWVAGAPLASMFVQLGLPGLIGVAISCVAGITMGQLLGRVWAPRWLHLGLGAFLLCAVSLLAPLHLHLLTGFGAPVAAATLFALVLATAMALFTSAFTDTARLPWIPMLTWVILGLVAMGATRFRPEVTLAAESPAHGAPIVLVTVAGLRASEVDPVATPNLHRLAESSLWFEDAHATSNWAVPSVGSVLTARLPYGHGAGLNDGFGPTGSALRPDLSTLASVLRYSSWITAGVSGDPRLRTYALDAGFERWTDFSDEGMLPVLLAPLSRAQADPWQWPTHASASWVTAEAVEVITARRGSGWLLFAHYADLDGVGAAARAQPLTEVDRAIGQLIDTAPGDAWVVVAGSHGAPSEGERSASRHAMEEGLLHVPLLMRIPRMAPGRVPGVVSVVDIAPTLLAGIGHRPLPRADGAPLERAFGAPQGERLAVAQSAAVGREEQAVLMGPHKLIHGIDGSTLLFDLSDDPQERLPLDPKRASMLERDLLSALPAPGTARGAPPPLWMQLGQLGSRVVGRR